MILADGVGQLVPSEITISPEYFPALIALVWLVISVSQQVGLQVGSLIETSLADGALVRRLLHVENLGIIHLVKATIIDTAELTL